MCEGAQLQLCHKIPEINSGLQPEGRKSENQEHSISPFIGYSAHRLLRLPPNQKQSALPQRSPLRPFQIRSRRNPAEQNKKIPECPEKSLLVAGSHGEVPRREWSQADASLHWSIDRPIRFHDLLTGFSVLNGKIQADRFSSASIGSLT